MNNQDEKTDYTMELLNPDNFIEQLLSMDMDVVSTIRVIKAFIT